MARSAARASKWSNIGSQRASPKLMLVARLAVITWYVPLLGYIVIIIAVVPRVTTSLRRVIFLLVPTRERSEQCWLSNHGHSAREESQGQYAHRSWSQLGPRSRRSRSSRAPHAIHQRGVDAVWPATHHHLFAIWRYLSRHGEPSWQLEVKQDW